MKPRRAWLFVVLLAAAAIVIFLGREPRYQGRSLTRWLQQSWDTPLMETQQLAEAQNAIRSIRPKKALPKLLKLVQSEDDPISMTIMHIVIPGTGRVIEREAKLFCEQEHPVPIFIKRRVNEWEYVGDYKAVSYTTDAAEIAAHHKGSITSLNEVTRVIFLQRAGAVK